MDGTAVKLHTGAVPGAVLAALCRFLHGGCSCSGKEPASRLNVRCCCMSTWVRLHVASSRCAVSCTSCQLTLAAEIPLSASRVAQHSRWPAGAGLRHISTVRRHEAKAGWGFTDLSVTCMADQAINLLGSLSVFYGERST